MPCSRTRAREPTRRSRTPPSWPAELDGATDLATALRRYHHRRRIRTRQVQAASRAASAALHLPDGPAAQQRDAYLAQLPERLAWIHGHDVLAHAAALT